jgi:hypothetical protein
MVTRKQWKKRITGAVLGTFFSLAVVSEGSVKELWEQGWYWANRRAELRDSPVFSLDDRSHGNK